MTITTTATGTTREQYLAAINAPGISAINVAWQSEVKPAAAHKSHVLVKYTQATVMTGVEYKDLAVNNDRETGPLPWGEWAVYPYIITHKGKDYARMNTVDGTLRTTYTVDGAIVTREQFGEYLTEGARKAKRPNGGTITVHLGNVTVL